jgi:hypothetical protein
LRNAIDAELAAEAHVFARGEVEARLEQLEAGLIDAERIEADIVGQLGLALRISPTRARTQLRIARDLHAGLDGVRESYTAGRLDERKVAAVVAAAAHLDPVERAELDRRLGAHDLATLGLRRVGDLARSIAAAVAPEKFAERARAARRDRHVTIGPAGDGMALLRAYLPVEQGVACYAALRKAVAEHWLGREPVTRTRGQIMADTLVERLTAGARTTADSDPETGVAGTENTENVVSVDSAATGAGPGTRFDVELQILVPVEALLDPRAPIPAEAPGYGPVPLHDLLSRTGRVTWRRLLTKEGFIIGSDSRRRTFTGVLADLVRARDRGRCTEPHCDAPATAIDHIRRWTGGGATSLTNGRSLCTFHNLLREAPGWTVTDIDGAITTTTPSGHRYTTRIRPPTMDRDTSEGAQTDRMTVPPGLGATDRSGPPPEVG